MVSVSGLLVALLSAVANGSFTVLSKLEPAKSSGVESLIFNFYTCIGAGLSSLLAPLFGITFAFTWLGFISGIFLCVSCANAFIAVKTLGVGVASGVWCGTAVVISFLFGEFFDTPVSNLPLALVGVTILVISIFGIAYSGSMAEKDSQQFTESLLENEGSSGKSSYVAGLISAVVAGILGGLIISPETWAPEEAQDLAYLPSFGIGSLVIAPIVTAIPYLLKRQKPTFYLAEAGPLGLGAGVIWNVANTCSIIAISKIGYSIAYPIMQCGLFVAGVWGIFLFGEISGPYQKVYWVSGGSLLVGAILLGLSS